MNQAEFLGAKLVMIVRREYEQEALLAEIRQERRDLLLRIRDMEAGSLYSSTGEFPRVSSTPVSPATAVTEVFSRPARSDRLDGGSTFHFHPIGDTVANMPAVPVSPATACAFCNQAFPHVHGPDGRIHAEVVEPEIETY